MAEFVRTSQSILKTAFISSAFSLVLLQNVQAFNTYPLPEMVNTDSLFAKDSLHLQFDAQSGIPIPPAYCTTRQEKAGFITRNWWKNTRPEDFYQYAHTEKAAEGEQRLVDFLSFLPLCDSINQQYSLNNLLTLAACSDSTNKTYNWVNDLLEKYLWDEESPMYNETLYAFVLRYRASRPEEEEGSKTRAAMLLPKLLQNQTGTLHNDLLLGLPDGSETTLHELLRKPSQKAYTLLILYDLDCVVCQELIDKITRISPQYPQLQVITIQLYKQNIPAWKSYIQQLPSQWIHTYDAKEAVFMEETYYMRSSSALYLLDKQGTILLKNAQIQTLQEYLSNH